MNLNINKRKIIFSAVLLVCFITIFSVGFLLGSSKQTYFVPQPGTLDFSLFWDAYNKLQQKFIDPSKITDKNVIYGAIEGMASSLKDPYTNFFDPVQAEKFQQDLNGFFGGIGIEIGIRKDLLTVVAPIKGTPAERAELKSGDIIVKIDGVNSVEMTTEEAVNRIRGQEGTTVTLTIARESWPSPKEIKIVRDTINVPSIEWSLKENDVAYIQIFHFDNTLFSKIRIVALEILQSPAKKIILDLRDNPGGYLEAAQEVAGWFLKSGQPITIEDFGGRRPQVIYRASGNSDLSDYPIVVLINQGSASASEILAGALRDNRSIKLIGTKSFGKGSVQEVVDLEGGSFLKITTAKWLTPKGASISEIGLTPDIKVELTDEDFEQKKDPQFEKALEIVKDLK